MDRLEKKCLVASTGMHLFLMCLLVLGSAFFVPTQKPVDISKLPRLQVIPGKLVDDLLSGGGGNPNLKITEDRIHGETMRPVAEENKEPPPPPKPEKAEPKKVESVAKVAPKPEKLNLVPAVRKPGKEPAKVSSTTPKDTDIKLTPAKRTAADKARQEAEAAAAAAKEYARAEGNRRRELAKVLGNTTQSLRAGFTDGTVVEVGGPGGIAYANYAQFVKEVYENAWMVPTDFMDENQTTRVVVVIERSGNVISRRIEKYSGNPSLDRSVQRALDSVKFVAPFPEGAKDQKRTFTINFNLKSKLG